jgi:predicted phage terminase large subunit-like protein
MDWRAKAQQKLDRMPEHAKELRELAERDLFSFAKLVNPGYMYGEVHKQAFKWLQEFSLYDDRQENTNKLLMFPRAHLKSHMVATWAAWCVTNHPEVTILYLSATAELAETQLSAIKRILESDDYQRYWPEFINPQEGKRSKWSERKISVDHVKRKKEGVRDATISTAGLTTNTTGWHADVILADDLVVPENAYTEDGRASVAKKSSQFTSIRNPGGITLACGTRYHPRDVYATWKEQMYDVFDEEYNIVDRKPVWQIRDEVVERDGIFTWPRTVRSDGKAFGFDMNVLARIKAEYSDRVQFYAQYYNDPNDPGSEMIRRDKFQYYDKKHLTHEEGKWFFKGDKLNVYASIDFAFTLSKGADYTALVVIGMDPAGHIYVLDIDRFKTDRIPEMFRHVTEMHSKWGFKKLRAEVGTAQGMIVNDLKDKIVEEGMKLSIDATPPPNDKRKAERISAALDHRYDNMSVWHYRGGYTDVLEEELVLARPAHDDVKDALAAAVEIAVKPKASRQREDHGNVIAFHPRFGGVSR